MRAGNVYELRAHFETCPACRAANEGATLNLGALCLTGAQLVKLYAHQARRALSRPGRRDPCASR